MFIYITSLNQQTLCLFRGAASTKLITCFCSVWISFCRTLDKRYITLKAQYRKCTLKIKAYSLKPDVHYKMKVVVSKINYVLAKGTLGYLHSHQIMSVGYIKTTMNNFLKHKETRKKQVYISVTSRTL